MADTGYKNPTSTGSPDNSWTNPTNAYTEDGTFAVDDHLLGAINQSYKTFGFGIPADATIKGIEVRIKLKVSSGTGSMGIAIGSVVGYKVNSSGTIGSKFLSGTVTTTNTAFVVGGPTDLWGVNSWEPEDFSDANFILNPGVSSGALDYSTDVVQVKVYYTTNASYRSTKSIPKAPGTAAVQANSNGQNDGNWTNPNNIKVSDFSFASGNTSNGGQNTAELYSSNYGFSIPTNATIDGIEVHVIKQGSPTLDFTAKLTKTANTPIGSDRSSASLWDFVLNLTKYGGPTDLWGTTWTPAEINSSGFGFAFAAYNQHGGGNADVQYERIMVYYSTPTRSLNSAIIGTNDSVTSGGGGFNYIGSAGSGATVTEAAFNQVVPCDMVLSAFNMTIGTAPGVGTSRTWTVRKNGVDTALTLTIADTATTATDLTHSVSFVAGDLVTLGQTIVGVPTSTGKQSWNLLATSAVGKQPLMGGAGGANQSNSATNYGPLGANVNMSTTETFKNSTIPTTGVISDLYVWLPSAPTSGKSWTTVLRVNGVDTALSAVVADAATTGNDTTNKISVYPGDVVGLRMTPSGTPTAIAPMYSVSFTPLNTGENILLASNATAPSTTAVNYRAPHGFLAWNATEALVSQIPGGAYTIKNLYTDISAAPGATKNYVFALRKNGSTTGLTTTVADPATTANAATNISVAQGDTIDLISTPTGTPTSVSTRMGMTMLVPTFVDLTLSSQYAVASTPSDVTKSAQYVVASPHDLTLSGNYVTGTLQTLTKSAAYSVAHSGSDIALLAAYVVSSSVDYTRTAAYATDPAPVQENLDSVTLRTLKIGKKYGPVTSVILGRVPQNDNIIIASTTPPSNVITSIDTATNLFTITGHSMANGNLVQVTSTGTLPAPLLANTNYFVFTAGSPNTFYLTPTYTDAINGSALIDLTSAGTGTITLTHLETQEVQINNNQIVDDDRQLLLPELYAQLVGLQWNAVKADTIGLPWHEVGDIVKFTQGAVTVNGFISEVHLVLDGSIKEQLVSIIPDVATINYQTAGGILKTIYNAEIKVDKQQNEITSIVSEQDVFATSTQTNFTEIYQNISDIILSIQKSGGGNLLLNSAGFAKENAVDNASVGYDKLSFWDYNPSYQISTHGTVKSYSSSESQNAGGISGETVEMAGASVYLTQRINVAANAPLSFGIRVNNAIASGDATITISNGVDNYVITVDDVAAYSWQEILLENFTSSLSFLDVKIQVTSATKFQFTDLRLFYGSSIQAWTQASSEILDTNVQFTKLGMRIFDNIHDTNTQVTYNEFSTRRKTDNLVLFEADDSGVITNDLSIKGSTNYYDGATPLIKQITIPRSSALAGIAFIKVVS